MSGPDCGVAQGLGQEALADAGGTDEQHMLVPGQKLQGECGVEEPAIQSDGRRSVEVLQAAGLLESGLLQAHLDAAAGPAVDLV